MKIWKPRKRDSRPAHGNGSGNCLITELKGISCQGCRTHSVVAPLLIFTPCGIQKDARFSSCSRIQISSALYPAPRRSRIPYRAMADAIPCQHPSAALGHRNDCRRAPRRYFCEALSHPRAANQNISECGNPSRMPCSFLLTEKGCVLVICACIGRPCREDRY
jgi:hypothetical protein